MRLPLSGAPWLSKLPLSWQVKPISTLFTERNQKNDGIGRKQLLSLSYGRVVRKDIDATDGLRPESYDTYQQLEPDNIVLRLIDLQNDKRSIRVGQATERGIITSAYVALNTDAWACPRYAFYLLLVLDQLKVFYGLGSGMRQSIKFSDLGRVPVGIPSEQEQNDIASYLDIETARIDGLIAEKQRLMKLLAEAESSAIERATLPSRGMRRSPLKRFADALSTGPFGSALHSTDYISDGIAVINPTHIVDGVVVPDPDVSVTSDLAARLSAYRLKPGDIVVGRRGEMGRCAVVPDGCFDWLCGTGCLMVTPTMTKVSPEYLQLVISSRASRDWLSLESVGSTMENLNTEILGRLPCYVPEFAEQLTRLRTCRDELDSLATLKLHVKEEVRLLEEMRSATITDAVLGRIDVRAHMKH